LGFFQVLRLTDEAEREDGSERAMDFMMVTGLESFEGDGDDLFASLTDFEMRRTLLAAESLAIGPHAAQQAIRLAGAKFDGCRGHQH